MVASRKRAFREHFFKYFWPLCVFTWGNVSQPSTFCIFHSVLASNRCSREEWALTAPGADFLVLFGQYSGSIAKPWLPWQLCQIEVFSKQQQIKKLGSHESRSKIRYNQIPNLFATEQFSSAKATTIKIIIFFKSSHFPGEHRKGRI